MPCQALKRPILRAFSQEEKRFYLYMARCKSWYCPTCGRINKLEWVAKVAEGIDHYCECGTDDWMFCTVTSHPKLRTRDQCLWVEPKAWKKLFSRIRYHHGKVCYVYIPELHKNGRVHWHFLMSGGIPVTWWKKHAPSCGFGYIFDSQPVRDGYNSVLYVSKELSKSLDITAWPDNLRRIRTSQKWPQIAPRDDFNEKELDWVYHDQGDYENLEYVRHEMETRSGIETVILGVEQ